MSRSSPRPARQARPGAAWAAKWEQLKVQAEQKAREAGDAAAKAVSQAAWAGVVVMLLGLAVSAAAGAFGRRSALRFEKTTVV